jgi:hypothetical protein
MRKLVLLCIPILLALVGCTSAPTNTAGANSAKKATHVHSTGDLVRLMRQTTSYEYEPYASPRAMLKDVDIALVGTVVSIKSALIADELNGQGAVIIGLQPRKIWKDDTARSGEVVYYYIQRPKNLGAAVYQRGLPAGTEVALFGFDAAKLVKFTQGDPGHTTYTPAPQGFLISGSDRGLVNVWAEGIESSGWKDIRSMADLEAAVGK